MLNLETVDTSQLLRLLFTAEPISLDEAQEVLGDSFMSRSEDLHLILSRVREAMILELARRIGR